MAKPKADQPKKRGFFRAVMSTFFDVPRWVNAKQYTEVNKTLYTKVKDSFRIARAQREETFEAAMDRLKVTEQDLKERIAANQLALTIVLIFIVLLCLYGFYLMLHGAVAGTLLVLAVVALSAVRAFQYSFWNFQIKNRKLGCSFSDWWRKSIT
ncbi:MAG: type IVB secretion system protein IcmV [Gammaproteobacteria bacterium]|nr:type IVB secretion system protein IcmV [Gammaproteobacteria bacterium]